MIYILDYVQLYFTSYTSLIMNKILLNILILSTIVLAGCSSTNKLVNSPTTWNLPSADENTAMWCMMWWGTNCDVIMNPSNKATYGQILKKACDMMPMPACKNYFGTTWWMINNSGMKMWGTNTMNHADMVTSEFDFIYLMIPHHQEAIDTTKKLLQTTKNPDIIKLGQWIVNGQSNEVNMMKWWLTTRFSGFKYEWMWYMPMMRSTAGLTPQQTDRQWAEDMIWHHQWALDMANKVLKVMNAQEWPLYDISVEYSWFRTTLRKFANDVITNQQKEIDQMKLILAK